MVLSVAVVLLLTLFYELLKVWRVRLGSSSAPPQQLFPVPPLLHSPYSPSPECQGSSAALASSPSESSLAPTEPHSTTAPSNMNRWLLHGLQTALHVLQVALGYMLMLCVMSYNTWIFLGVIIGSVLGYFIAFPLLGQI
ncbi:protein SLC31A2 isoform 2-T2 [Aplochiton taeniatus]